MGSMRVVVLFSSVFHFFSGGPEGLPPPLRGPLSRPHRRHGLAAATWGPGVALQAALSLLVRLASQFSPRAFSLSRKWTITARHLLGLLPRREQRPPFSVDLFSAEQVKRLAEFVINTYFRHFKLYKYMFTPQVRLDVTLSYAGMSEESVVQEDEEQKPSSSPEPSSEEQSPDAALVEEQGPSPRAELRHYIQSELSAEVSRLQASVEEKLRLNAEALSSKLAQLEERSAGQRDKSHKGKKK
ncbi:UNVERIFIED_CONTAM: hypothetical protein FKN15_056538 [Acipenser sinensis]